jgi:hypothetical protein
MSSKIHRICIALVAVGAIGATFGVSTASATTLSPAVTLTNGQFVDTTSGAPVAMNCTDVIKLDVSYLQLAQAGGFNCIRVRVPWATIEKEDGVFDTTKLEAFLSAADSAGMMIFIDNHQIRSSSTCFKQGAVGIPEWFYREIHHCSVAYKNSSLAAWWTSTRGKAAYGAFLQNQAELCAEHPYCVGEGIWNEPGGSACNTQTGANSILAWEHGMLVILRKYNAGREISFMVCGGGDLWLMHADLKQVWGTNPTNIVLNKAHAALEFHFYINGKRHAGCAINDLSPNGGAWCPSWPATHNQADLNYGGCTATSFTPAQQAAALAVETAQLAIPLQRSRAQHIGLIVGEWGIQLGDCGASVYQPQMMHLFKKDTISANVRYSLTSRPETSSPSTLELENGGVWNTNGKQMQQLLGVS